MEKGNKKEMGAIIKEKKAAGNFRMVNQKTNQAREIFGSN